MSLSAEATVATPEASKYLQQLCKHFQHKLPVTFDPHAGALDFPKGRAKLAAAGETLSLAVEAESEADLKSLEDVVARHLARFAFRETLEIVWREGPASA